MLSKTYIALLSSVLLSDVYAGPELKMHVFDQQQTSISNSNQTHSAPKLKMHVFDISPSLQNNAVTLAYKERPKQVTENTLLNYDNANVYIKTGYRRDNFDYNIGTRSGSPNILSELKWKDIDIATINIGTTFRTRKKWLINFDLLYGHIFHGENQDSDYLGDNRTQEFSRSYASSDKGDVLDVSTYVGYDFLYETDKSYPNIAIIPKLGLSYKSQNFTMTDGVLAVSEDAPAYGFTAQELGPFSGLDSSYDATWFGPWTGLSFIFDLNPNVTISTNSEFHWVDYNSVANWNLRGDFQHPRSFEHEAKGYGVVGSIDGSVVISSDLSLSMSLNYQYFRADQDGDITRYLADGTVVKGQPFNQARWRSFGTNIGIDYKF